RRVPPPSRPTIGEMTAPTSSGAVCTHWAQTRGTCSWSATAVTSGAPRLLMSAVDADSMTKVMKSARRPGATRTLPPFVPVGRECSAIEAQDLARVELGDLVAVLVGDVRE